MSKSSHTVDFKGVLRAQGLKATPARLKVLKTLFQSGKPQSIQQILESLEAKESFKVTVYRVLADLKGTGIVRQVDFQQPHAYYELADPADHHHLVCVKCNRIEDFIGCDADNMADAALKKSTGFARVTGHSFELFGLCNRCA
jgi:Fur family ferric uptake transcriptional regulator